MRLDAVELAQSGSWTWGWAAVEALATVAAALGAIAALVYAAKAARSAKETLDAQGEQLRIESQRWQEESSERMRSARMEAAKLTVDSVARPEGGISLTLTNTAEVQFVHVVVEADPDHPGQAESRFAFLVSTLRPGEQRLVDVPTGVWWRVTYFDFGWRKWAHFPTEDGTPVRLEPPEV